MKLFRLRPFFDSFIFLILSKCYALLIYKRNQGQKSCEKVLLSRGGHLVRCPWSAISAWAWYWNLRYRTEESGVWHYIDIIMNFYPISDIPLFIDQHNGWLRCSPVKPRGKGSFPAGVNMCFEIGYRKGSWCRFGTLPTSEWQFLVWHIFFRYQNNRCQKN